MKNLPLVIWLLGWPAVFFGIHIEIFYGFNLAKLSNILFFFFIWFVYAHEFKEKVKENEEGERERDEGKFASKSFLNIKPK